MLLATTHGRKACEWKVKFFVDEGYYEVWQVKKRK